MLGRTVLEEAARRRAQRKQWMTMLAPALAALLIVALFGVAWNLIDRRRAEEGR